MPQREEDDSCVEGIIVQFFEQIHARKRISENSLVFIVFEGATRKTETIVKFRLLFKCN
jgi:hypothetical protein